MTPCLVVDTSIQGVAVGLADLAAGGALAFSLAHPENMGSVVAISGLVTDCLAQAGLRAGDLAACVVGQGPGSFTGIKVGLAFVYGLRMASGRELPVLGASAVEAVSRELVGASGAGAVFLPATRTHGFVGVAAVGGGGQSALVDAENPSVLDALLGGLPRERRLGIVGEWTLLQEALGARGIAHERIAPAEACSRALTGMAKRAAEAWPAGFGRAIPEPRYLRLSTAEERLQQLGGHKP